MWSNHGYKTKSDPRDCVCVEADVKGMSQTWERRHWATLSSPSIVSRWGTPTWLNRVTGARHGDVWDSGSIQMFVTGASSRMASMACALCSEPRLTTKRSRQSAEAAGQENGKPPRQRRECCREFLPTVQGKTMLIVQDQRSCLLTGMVRSENTMPFIRT